ncbi:MAG TPA: hypothetical protein VKU82_01660 [Planctomycetaceae bacterium]|nr:hypothetical protein [Planctomycetaceae bacterium]
MLQYFPGIFALAWVATALSFDAGALQAGEIEAQVIASAPSEDPQPPETKVEAENRPAPIKLEKPRHG